MGPAALVQLVKASLFFLIALTSAISAQAQSFSSSGLEPLFFEESLRAVPHPDSINTVLNKGPLRLNGGLEDPQPPVSSPSDEYVRTQKMAQSWAARLRAIHRRYSAILKTGANDCDDEGFADYLEALASRGQFENCFELVNRCQQRSLTYDVSIGAARCAVAIYKWPEALRYYELASRTARSTSVYTPFMFSFGSFLLVSPYAEQMKTKLQEVSNAPDDQIDLLIGAVKFAQLQVAPAGGVDVAWTFIEKGVNSFNSKTHLFFAAVKAQALYGAYRYEEARQVIQSNLKSWTQSDQLWPLGYSALYANKYDLFKLSEIVYKAYVPYAHKRSSLPIESNNYNYTELYRDVCKTHLLQGADLNEYRRQIQQWQRAQISTSDLWNFVQQKIKNGLPTADLLATAGSLSLMRGEREIAQSYFWRSHQACPNYNRAHWGLQTIRKMNRNRSYTDYDDLESNFLKAIQNIDYGQNTAQYVLNYSILSEDEQNKLKYGARIWGPYFDLLKSQNRSVYIKSAFELLSETPSLETLRDARIGGENYPNDNRLWDDVRGVGGATVVADYGELSQIAQGAYNTIGHEVAHQFHYALIDNQSSLTDCIQNLYTKAKERNLFADGYAALNQYEYFAQAVTYYLVPESSPQRFGLNRRWSLQNDPKMHELVERIQKASGQIDQIACPSP